MKGTQSRDPQCRLLRVLGLMKPLSAPPAEVGPPSRVALSHEGKDVDVYINDPMASNNASMKKFLPNLSYRILYWEGPSLAQVAPLLCTLLSFTSSSADTCCSLVTLSATFLCYSFLSESECDREIMISGEDDEGFHRS